MQGMGRKKRKIPNMKAKLKSCMCWDVIGFMEKYEQGKWNQWTAGGDGLSRSGPGSLLQEGAT